MCVLFFDFRSERTNQTFSWTFLHHDGAQWIKTVPPTWGGNTQVVYGPSAPERLIVPGPEMQQKTSFHLTNESIIKKENTNCQHVD